MQTNTNGPEPRVTLDVLHQQLNDRLDSLPDSARQAESSPYPVILIVGCARSGTTLLLQWLASLGKFGYPTNFIARFFKAPVVGALLQEILFNKQFKHPIELADLSPAEVEFSSKLGKTSGVLSPSEFFYFWRRFFPNWWPQPLAAEMKDLSAGRALAAETMAVMNVLQKPWAMKGLLLQYDLDFLDRLFPKAVFLHVNRTPLYNMQSLLQSREKLFGNRDEWYSVRPPEYDWLKDLSVYDQVAGQVHFTRLHLERQLSEIDKDRKLSIDYEAFCADPEAVCNMLQDRLRQQGNPIPAERYGGIDRISMHNRKVLPPAEMDQLQRSLDRMQNHTSS